MTSTEALFTRFEEYIRRDNHLTLAIMVFGKRPGAQASVPDFLMGRERVREVIRATRAEIISQESQEFLEVASCLYRGGLSCESACDAAHLIVGS